MGSRYRIGFDIGGTFTDFVLLDAGARSIQLHKVLTTTPDPAEGALAGLAELCGRAGIELRDVGTLVHGTTLVTNTIIERTGAPTALLTTRGFRDILEMGKEQRYDIYDLFLQFPPPLVPRRWRCELDERISRDGDVLVPLDPAQVREAARTLWGQGVASLAIALLHAYKNPAHEQAALAAVREACPDLSVSLSSDVVPEIREWERMCTTVCNAYVQPLVDRYLRKLETALGERGFAGRFYLMQSSGGTATAETARRFPVRLLESGPAGGALVTAFFGERLGRRDLVAFDMGGTTAKICLIREGRPEVAPMIEAARVHRFKRGSGLPIKAPVVDMMEIGAGGGSIARTDRLGLLKVGPHSAGASPGPACYGRGGDAATVTDACLVLGYFDPDYFLGGAMRLDRDAATAALGRLGADIGMDAVSAAWGVHQIVSENMAAAARVYMIERGQDPRRYAMLAFGGAGPAHASRVARILGVRAVIVPPASGAASALGFLVTPLSFEFVHSLPGTLDILDWDAVDQLYTTLEAQGRAMLADGGIRPGQISCERRAEMRLAGQFHDLEVPVPAGQLTPAVVPALAARFESEYRRLYGTYLSGRQVLVLNWRVLVAGPRPSVNLGESPAVPGASAGDAFKRRRRAYFPELNGFCEVPVYDRYRLRAGAALRGPAIVEEREATTVIGPGDALEVDRHHNLVIAVAEEAVAVPPAVDGRQAAS
jgi:5-oxoprolinase (ATP-hydrolysing)